MTHEYKTDRRVALDLNLMLAIPGLHYSPVTTSTQSDVKQLLEAGAQMPVVVITEEQTAGRGRLDRIWTAPPFSSVLMSVGLPLPKEHTAFALQVGVAVRDALAACGVAAALKWPNDVVVEVDGRWRKLGGMLVELHRQQAVVGVGLNIDLTDAELPTADAISCRQLGLRPRREDIIVNLVPSLEQLPAPDMLARYRERCVTIGAQVQVARLVGEPLRGRALAVDDEGALLVLDHSGVEHRVTVGDVQLLRPEVSG